MKLKNVPLLVILSLCFPLFLPLLADPAEDQAVLVAQNIFSDGTIPDDLPDPEALISALKNGCNVKKDAQTGKFVWSTKIGKRTFNAALNVPTLPKDKTRLPVILFLHGGINANRPNSGSMFLQPALRLMGNKAITVTPSADSKKPWWSIDQVEHFNQIIRRLSRTYPVDTNRIFLCGHSDGGAGTFYAASLSPTRFAGFLPFMGNPAVLHHRPPQVEQPRDLYLNNMASRPILTVIGKRDQLHPFNKLLERMKFMQANGVSLQISTPNIGHAFSWSKKTQGETYMTCQRFIKQTRRDPFPTNLSLRVHDTTQNNRTSWLQINKLGEGDVSKDLNLVLRPKSEEKSELNLFQRRHTSGQILAKRQGNNINITAENVTSITVLVGHKTYLSTEPLTVTINGKEVFNRLVKPDSATLAKWAAKDLDPEMLFVQEMTFSEFPATFKQ